MDAALIKLLPTEVQLISNTMPQVGSPKQPRALFKEDIGQVKVCIHGARSGYVQGTLLSAYADVKLRYSDTKMQMINLIAIGQNGKSMAKPGDSGAIVLDEDNNVIGLVVGGTRRETYVMPIETLLLKMNVQLA
jgi:hypothetical protein